MAKWQSGKLRNLITIQQATITYDTVNQPIETWVPFDTFWAAIITTGGREFYASQKLYAETNAVFEIRYDATLTTLMRIYCGGRIFNILGINDVDEMHTTMLISAKEAV